MEGSADCQREHRRGGCGDGSVEFGHFVCVGLSAAAANVFTLIDGGPESAIYKSTDAGVTWNKLKEGLPKVDMGQDWVGGITG